MGALLQQLGFRRAGRHRSKDLTLYRQGGINLILNADPYSFARVHFLEYGPSVCAIGLATDDPVRALNRATALQAPRFDGRLGPDDPPLPAITAPDGSVIYFIDAAFGANGLFEAGFDLSSEEPGAEAGAQLQTIDHIALGLPTGALDTWVLFCRAVLGMQPGDSHELSDPYGLIRSAGMASEDRSVRFVLNVSLSQRTRTARTIGTLGGRSVHHIGIGCSDIVATVSRLRAAGADFVPISPNYYDDLLARLDLDPGRRGPHARAGNRLRPLPRRRVLSRLRNDICGPLLFRDRAARRCVRCVRRIECPGTDGLPGAGRHGRRSAHSPLDG